jgi:hypothetical protein
MESEANPVATNNKDATVGEFKYLKDTQNLWTGYLERIISYMNPVRDWE